MGQNNIADLLLRGEGVVQNDSEAFRWFEKAAVQGHTGARIKLGYMHAAGRGTQRNPQAAYQWIIAATLDGDQRGQYLVGKLESQLTAAQVRNARERAHILFAQTATSKIPAQAFLP